VEPARAQPGQLRLRIGDDGIAVADLGPGGGSRTANAIGVVVNTTAPGGQAAARARPTWVS